MAFIITGLHRSGTSILALVCKSHPAIAVTNEFGNFFGLDSPFDVYARSVFQRWLRRRNVPYALASTYPNHVKGFYMLQNLGFVCRYLLALSGRTRGAIDVRSIDETLYRLFPHAQVCGDKHPDYIHSLSALSQVQGLRIIVIYREPRDMVSSTVQAVRDRWRAWFPASYQDVKHVAKLWVHAIEQTERFSEHVLSISYEKLIKEPETVLHQLGDWLAVEPGGFQRVLLHNESIGRYQDYLTPREVEDVLAIAGPTMQRLGYQV